MSKGTVHIIFKIQFVFYALICFIVCIPFICSLIFTPICLIDCFVDHYHSSESFLEINGRDIILPLIAIDVYAFFLFVFLRKQNKILTVYNCNDAVHTKLHWKIVVLILPLAVLSSGMPFLANNISRNALGYGGVLLTVSSLAVVVLNTIILIYIYKRKQGL